VREVLRQRAAVQQHVGLRVQDLLRRGVRGAAAIQVGPSALCTVLPGESAVLRSVR
jgi:hypothetical protein